MPSLLKRLLGSDEARFLKTVETLTIRLATAMKAATNPNAGILAVTTSSADGAQRPEHVSVLKLDATHKGARFRLLAKGGVRLSVLKDLLPSPGQLQKGISWPDPREGSDVIIRDRNIENALYFLNAYQVQVARKASDVERTLLDAVAQLPPADVPRAYVAAASRAGSADTVVAELGSEFAGLNTDQAAFGAHGQVPGVLRPNRVAARGLKVVADGFEIRVPVDRASDITWDPSADGYVITINVDSQPRWVSG
jgi:hypothetical protein